MMPHQLCAYHLDLHRRLVTLASAIHGESTPGRSRLLPTWIADLAETLAEFLECYHCCRPGDRIGELLTIYLRERYLAYHSTASDRETARNLRRHAYNLTPFVSGLAVHPSTTILNWSRPGTVEAVPGSHFEQHLRAHGEQLALLPAAHSLGAYLASLRQLPDHLWFDYVVSRNDATLLEQLRGNPWLHRFASYGVDWFAAHPSDRIFVLDLLGWADTLDNSSRSTLEVLLYDWHGSIVDAINAARHLS